MKVSQREEWQNLEPTEEISSDVIKFEHSPEFVDLMNLFRSTKKEGFFFLRRNQFTSFSSNSKYNSV